MKSVKIFLSYSHVDEPYKNDLAKHLQGMVRAGYIETWNDREILPGQEWSIEIKKALDDANIILFLISPDFIASGYINNVEIASAIKKQHAGEIIIIPVIIRPCDFESLKLINYQAVPQGEKAISTWENKDSAWLDVVQQLKRVISSVYQKEENQSCFEENMKYEKAKKGKVLYQIPRIMQKSKESKCRVRVAFTEELVKSMLRNTDDITIRGIRISDTMEVELLDPNETATFNIRTISRNKQFIGEDDFTEWIFFVKPLQEGTFSLFIKIAIIELINEEKEIREYVMEEEIEIISSANKKDDEEYEFKSSGYSFNIAAFGAVTKGFPADKSTASSLPSAAVPGGCFIATAAFGTPLSQEVETLRYFRDQIALKSKFKKEFKWIFEKYYQYSPLIAEKMCRNKFVFAIMKYGIVYPALWLVRIIFKS